MLARCVVGLGHLIRRNGDREDVRGDDELLSHTRTLYRIRKPLLQISGQESSDCRLSFVDPIQISRGCQI